MLSSMTGFGRAVLDTSFGRLTIEIQSVNRKYLEMFISLPKELGRFELEMRKWVGEKVHRGQVSLRIFLDPNVEALLPDVKLLRKFKKEWDKIAKELKTEAVDLPFLIEHLPVGKKGMEGGLEPLKKGISQALDELLKMKKTEGKALAEDLLQRVQILLDHLKQIEMLSPEASHKMRKKLVQRMEELFGADVEERVLREIALFAEKVDITEELIRLKSHFHQFQEMMKKDGSGRKLDFLIQEMGREINTIGSKSMEAKIAHLVVEMKSELEKMREQIQNIE